MPLNQQLLNYSVIYHQMQGPPLGVLGTFEGRYIVVLDPRLTSSEVLRTLERIELAIDQCDNDPDSLPPLQRLHSGLTQLSA